MSVHTYTQMQLTPPRANDTKQCTNVSQTLTTFHHRTSFDACSDLLFFLIAAISSCVNAMSLKMIHFPCFRMYMIQQNIITAFDSKPDAKNVGILSINRPWPRRLSVS